MGKGIDFFVYTFVCKVSAKFGDRERQLIEHKRETMFSSGFPFLLARETKPFRMGSTRVGDGMTALTAMGFHTLPSRFLRNCLGTLGAQVHEVEDAVGVINLCESGSTYDAIFVSMDLAAGAGPQAIRYLREMGVDSKLIGVTTENGEKIIEFMEAGLDYCLEMPFYLRHIARILESV
ncbi:hypothetical protein IFM89_016554 [Coptis chinensis]|uniref:Response regulatory domain-containing protein n=1 Tax=Coptis chinensis TaxID=261450 RepID=A0A835ID91_9MAGN|nr:hypothetical protein IFM89_016554 [Coptis chinensis]